MKNLIKLTFRARNSPLIKYANFEEGSFINLIELNQYKRNGMAKYKDKNKYAISIVTNNDQEFLKFRTLDQAESIFDELVSQRKSHTNLIKESKTGNYAKDNSIN